MQFVLKTNKTYPWPIEVKTPSEKKAGEFDTETFTATFKCMKRKKLKKFDQDMAKADTALEREELVDELLKEATVGWDGICSAPDVHIDFNKDNFEMAMEDNFFRMALSNGFFASIANQAARVKN